MDASISELQVFIIIHHHDGSVCVLTGRQAVTGTKKTNRWRSLWTNKTRESESERELSLCLSGHMRHLLLCIHVGMREM